MGNSFSSSSSSSSSSLSGGSSRKPRTPDPDWVTFYDVQRTLKDPSQAHLISTLPSTEQGCLLPYTVPWQEEEPLLNACLADGRVDGRWVVYGRNAYDPTVEAKVAQLRRLGFSRVSAYRGGLMEWMGLREQHGSEWFPATGPADWDALYPPPAWTS